MAASNFLEEAILNFMFRDAPSPRQDTYYLALFTTSVQEDGTGVEVSDSDWLNYQRLPLDATSANTIFSQATQENGKGTTNNTEEIDFGVADVKNQVDIVSFAIMDDETGGEVYLYGDLPSTKPVTNDDPVRVPINNLTISLD